MLIFAWIRVGSSHSDNSFYMYKVFQKSKQLRFLVKNHELKIVLPRQIFPKFWNNGGRYTSSY